MTQRNNIPIKYKGQTIWTNAQLLRVFTLLLLGDLKNADSSCDLVLKPFYIEFNFESIFSDELELKKVKESIARTNSGVNKDDLIANQLGQRIGAILKSITPQISNRELSKQVTEVTRIRPGAISELFIQIERLLNEEEPFRTDEQISIDYLLGRWKSRTNNSYSIHISVPAMDWSANKTLELKLMDGRVLLDKGMLKITEFADSNTYKMPIIRADNGQLETYLFKTKIIFEKVSMG